MPSALLARCPGYDYAGNLLGDKTNTVIFNNAKLHRLVPAYAPRKRFDQAARESIAYFLAHPELQIEDPDFDRFCDALAAIMEQAEEKIAAL